MELLTDPQVWLAFLTLTALEIVLGIDNIIFISILVGRLPKAQQQRGRTIGLALAMITRILLLLSITWVMGLSADLFTVGRVRHLGARPDPDRRRPVPAGEEHAGDPQRPGRRGGSPRGRAAARPSSSVILQIAIIDIVFSLDSVITAVGMADHVEVMIAAVIVAVLVMMFLAGPISDFVDRHPTIKMLALSFLILIGMALVGEGFEFHIPKGYIYFAMAFSVAVEMLNIRVRAQADGGAGEVEEETGRRIRVGLKPDLQRGCGSGFSLTPRALTCWSACSRRRSRPTRHCAACCACSRSRSTR